MNLRITHYRQEIKKRFYFFLKLIIFFGLLYVQKRYPEFYISYGISENLMHALQLYVTLVLLLSLSRISLIYIYNKKKKKQHNYRDNFILGINKISTILSNIVLFISILGLLDIPIGQFFTSISIVAAAIAIISKDYITNMINGMILMFSDQLSLSDNIKIGEFKGRIIDITLMNVHLMTDDNELIYIPNTTVFGSNVVNYTKRSNRNFSFEFELNPDQIESTQALELYLKSVIEPYYEAIKEETVSLKIEKITNDKVLLKLQMNFIKNSKDLEKELKKVLAHSIFDYLYKRNPSQERQGNALAMEEVEGSLD